nr:TetR/AcrR family transcriptional regulator [Nesterenkonia lacusekhoensis]
MTQRERNQRDTWNAIYEAAHTFARDEGLGAATVEAVAAQAGISRRTFFNYFPTKEDAILGTRLPWLDETVVERLTTSEEDELTRTVHAFVSVLRTALTEETAVRRREIVAQHPSLRGRLGQLITKVEELVREAMQEAAARREDAGDPASQEVLLMLSGVIIKHSFTQYFEGEPQAAADRGAAVEDFLEGSIAQFRTAILASGSFGEEQAR